MSTRVSFLFTSFMSYQSATDQHMPHTKLHCTCCTCPALQNILFYFILTAGPYYPAEPQYFSSAQPAPVMISLTEQQQKKTPQSHGQPKTDPKQVVCHRERGQKVKTSKWPKCFQQLIPNETHILGVYLLIFSACCFEIRVRDTSCSANYGGEGYTSPSFKSQQIHKL